MTKSFFKEACKRIMSDIMPGIPDNTTMWVRNYGKEDGIEIMCDGFKYRALPDGKEYITCPEGLNDED